ncbi:MAG: DNA internalization-related competence protein ComEC/Rec2 [Eggerthellaceae bacterium]
MKVRLNLPKDTKVYCWQYVTGAGELKEPSEQSFPSYWKKACVASLSLDNPAVSDPGGFLGLVCLLRDRSLGALERAYPSGGRWEDASTLVKAVLFGDRTELFASDLYGVMKTVGLAHIVAVSGAHLVMVTGFAVMILLALGVPRKICIPLQLAIVVSYACLTALPVSVLRAAVMSFCALASFYAKRASASVNALAICVVGIISFNPFLALSISLVLSACASLGIMLLSQGVSCFLASVTSGHGKLVTDSLSVCVSANAFTLPFSISVFGQIPLIAPVSNLLAAPVFPFLVCYGLGSVFLSLLLPAASKLLLFPLMLAASAFCALARLLAGIPFACVAADGEVLSLFASVLILITGFRFAREALSDKWLALCAVFLLLVLGTAFFVKPYLKGDEVIMCDVGQGDAIVLRSGGHAVLVDTGTNDSALLKALARHGVRKLDAVLISHPDDDHCGSLEALFAAVPVGRVCVPEGVLESDKESCRKLAESVESYECCGLLSGDSLSVGAFQVDILSPKQATEEGGNEDSLVLLAGADVDGNGEVDWTFLLTGDAEAKVIEPLLDDRLEGVDVLKVPHHGSAASVSAEMLQVLRPSLALVSVGEKNRYGHPTNEALSLLESAGAHIVRTDEMGDVVCKLKQDRIQVECLK